MLDSLPRRIKILSVFLAGFLVFSFVFTSLMHFTVGQDICQLSESLEAEGSDAANIISSESSCPGLFERWITALSNPLVQPFFWTVSILGGILSSGIYWYRERSK